MSAAVHVAVLAAGTASTKARSFLRMDGRAIALLRGGLWGRRPGKGAIALRRLPQRAEAVGARRRGLTSLYGRTRRPARIGIVRFIGVRFGPCPSYGRT